ncbi:hypothetical protein HanXRQr2_Chr01g0039661 [Helianthus annuus]|uniref:Uncharacterized protein n=1 Tax=Helianthus annuus TaxID=4232 RepID=A0A9K3JY74_HELAN|nr:hypothetical protein HanXRQr2_Chr01g0039661 [Helianthus annuus]
MAATRILDYHLLLSLEKEEEAAAVEEGDDLADSIPNRPSPE